MANSWRRSAETLQACSIVRSLWPIPGAGLRVFSRPAPLPSHLKCNLPCFCPWRPFRAPIQVQIMAFLPLETIQSPGPSANHGVFAPGGRSEPRSKCKSWRFCPWKPFRAPAQVQIMAFLPLEAVRCRGPSANHGVFAPGGRSEPRPKCKSRRFCT